MKTFIIEFLIVISILLTCFLSESYAVDKKIFRTSDRRTISFGQMVADIKKTNFILIGELHDNESHHLFELDAIKALRASKIPIAVGFEMFTAESQKDLDRWVAGIFPLHDFIRFYYENWNFPWPFYEDILLYVRDNKIPAVGLNVPVEIAAKVANSGFSSLTRKERERLPREVTCAVDEQYMKFIRRAYAIHGHIGKQFVYFCEAQLLWDQVMARNLLEFLKKNPDRTVIVLTGTGHAWKRGIPEQIRNLSQKTRFKVILPEISDHTEPKNISTDDADYIFLR